jgi:dTDP-4-amino-4,6-dideoxygalactose transaminase
MFKVHIDKVAALKKIEEVFDSGFINEGTQVAELTSALKDRLGHEQIILTNSGTSALTMALVMCGVGPGTNVVSTPMTCVASNTPIVTLGADIVWADVDPESGMPTPQHIAEKIDANTRAVLVVDWAGVPPELDKLREVCSRQNIPLIQDAAHAFGAEYKGKPVACWADFTMFSLQAIKHFTTGDGGVLVCDSANHFEAAKKLKWFGLDRETAKDAAGNWKGQQAEADILPGEVGYKFNMNNIAAAIGLSQLPHVDAILAAHRRNAQYYTEALSSHLEVKPLKHAAKCNPSHWVYTLVLQEETLDRDRIVQQLVLRGIHAGVVHVPNQDYSAFSKYKGALPGVDQFSSRQFALPCGWWISEDDAQHIVSELIGILKAQS